jgi:hypothetical protein
MTAYANIGRETPEISPTTLDNGNYEALDLQRKLTM